MKPQGMESLHATGLRAQSARGGHCDVAGLDSLVSLDISCTKR